MKNRIFLFNERDAGGIPAYPPSTVSSNKEYQLKMSISLKDLSSDGPHWNFDHGMSKFKRGNYQGAIQNFSLYIETCSQASSQYYNIQWGLAAYYYRAKSYFHFKEFDCALRDYNKALEIVRSYYYVEPGYFHSNLLIYSFDILFDRGLVYSMKKNYQCAFEDYKSAKEELMAHKVARDPSRESQLNNLEMLIMSTQAQILNSKQKSLSQTTNKKADAVEFSFSETLQMLELLHIIPFLFVILIVGFKHFFVIFACTQLFLIILSAFLLWDFD